METMWMRMQMQMEMMGMLSEQQGVRHCAFRAKAAGATLRSRCQLGGAGDLPDMLCLTSHCACA